MCVRPFGLCLVAACRRSGGSSAGYSAPRCSPLHPPRQRAHAGQPKSLAREAPDAAPCPARSPVSVVPTTLKARMTSFSDLNLAQPLLRALEAEGYTVPTPIQAAAIPLLLGGKDLLGIAQTGTGKTAAFALPLLQRLVEANRRPQPRSVRLLVLTPTRELAI